MSDSMIYPSDSQRDLRIDFIRGMVMFSLLVVHLDFFSFYNLIVWERIGVVAGAEGFVILSGVVIGMIYGKHVKERGWLYSIGRLFDRAMLLYRVNIFVIVSVALLSLLPYLDTKAIMTFTDQYTKQVYDLYPVAGTNIKYWVANTALLKIGPHQFQIIGLYVVLVFLSPLAIYMFGIKRTGFLLALSWIIYFGQWAYPSRPLGAQFGYAFPTLAWQLIFFHGMAVGYHRYKIMEIMKGKWRRPILVTSGILFLIFLFYTWNNPIPQIPEYLRLSIIPADTFSKIYEAYFQKNSLGILRLVNYTVVLIVIYYTLTRYWKIFNRVFGWYFIPVGQASLYVFIVHVYCIWIISNIPWFYQGHFWINTLGHTIILAIPWFLVRYQVLYRWIPR